MAALFKNTIAVASVAIALVGLAIFSGILNFEITASQINGLSLLAVGFAAVAIFYAIDAHEQLNRLKAGELNQKIAMIYNYASYFHSTKLTEATLREYLQSRILHDVLTMKNLGKIKTLRDEVMKARDALFGEMQADHYDTTELAKILDEILCK